MCVSVYVGAYGPHICPQLIKPFLLSISVLMGMGLNHGYKIINFVIFLFILLFIYFEKCTTNYKFIQ